jgi:hypothetical protein
MSIAYFVSETTTENNTVCVKHNEGQFGENERDSPGNKHTIPLPTCSCSGLKARPAAVLALLDCTRQLIPLQQKLKYSLVQAPHDKLAFHRPLPPCQHAQHGIPIFLKISGCHGHGKADGFT